MVGANQLSPDNKDYLDDEIEKDTKRKEKSL